MNQKEFDELAQVIGAISKLHPECQNTTVLCLYALTLLKTVEIG